MLGCGILGGYFAEYLLLLPFVLQNRYKPRFILDFESRDIKETIYLVGPIIVGIGVSQINKIIDKSIASSIVVGGISALNYASIINNAIQEVLVTGIITILFAKCAAWVAEGRHELVKDRLSITIQTMIFILIPSMFGVIACSESIVKIILMRGEFNSTSLKMTSEALCCYTLGLTFLAIRDTLVKVFYAYKNTRTTTFTSIIAILINIVLNIALSKVMGISGLALATSISAVFQCLVLYYILNIRIGDFGTQDHICIIVKSGAGAIIMYIVIICLKRYTISLSQNVSLMLSIAIGVIVYIVLSLLMHNEALFRIMFPNKNNDLKNRRKN